MKHSGGWGVFATRFTAATAGVLAVLAPRGAQADEPPPPAAAPPAAEPTPAPATAPPAKADAPATAPAAAAPAEAKPTPWYEQIQLGAFVDSYYSLNYRFPKPNANANRYHPYDNNAGFGLTWIGLDASVAPDPVGGTLQLRFGPSVPNLALQDFALPGGIGNIQNGYVSWKPGGKDGKLTLIGGKFDTLYGAEVAVSHQNMNYTRGALYNLAQPFFHTGLRADWAATDQLTLKVIAVNGWNNTLDNNRGKSFGAQLTWVPTDTVSLAAGYLGGPEAGDTASVTCLPNTAPDATGACAPSPNAPGGTFTSDVAGANSRWRHLADVVADLKPSKSVRILVNGTFVTDTVIDSASGADKNVTWFGAALMGRYALNDTFAGALRGEVIRDPHGQITAPNTGSMTLVTGTLTLEAAPTKYLVFRLDNRLDWANEAVFQDGTSGTAKSQITTTLGLVAKTN